MTPKSKDNQNDDTKPSIDESQDEIIKDDIVQDDSSAPPQPLNPPKNSHLHSLMNYLTTGIRDVPPTVIQVWSFGNDNIPLDPTELPSNHPSANTIEGLTQELFSHILARLQNWMMESDEPIYMAMRDSDVVRIDMIRDPDLRFEITHHDHLPANNGGRVIRIAPDIFQFMLGPLHRAFNH